MNDNILIVEDEFIVANDLKLILEGAGYTVCGIATSSASAQKMIEKYRPAWVLLDIFLKDNSMGTDLAGQLSEANIGFIYISANTNQSVLEKAKNTRPYGFLVKPFKEKDLLLMLDIAMNKHREKLKLNAQGEYILQRQLHQIAESKGSLQEKMAMLPQAFQGVIPFDFLRINTNTGTSAASESAFSRISFSDYQLLQGRELWTEIGITPAIVNRYKLSPANVMQSGISNGYDYRRGLLDDVMEKKLADHFGLQSKMVSVFNYAEHLNAAISFYSLESDGYSYAHLSLLKYLHPHLQAVFSSCLMSDPLIEKKEIIGGLTNSNTPRHEQAGFEGIIGSSPALLKVFDHISIVASTPVSVLILGESGTGKEGVARALHNRSDRCRMPLIIVNCAALPVELIEAELFGYEKGAFTGAMERRAGKFEAADGGTIFLDEIGELPLEAQVKLLRVLQEHEFERLGSNKTIKTDVRVIAATNRNPQKEVGEGRLRLDLYYRLNVFPIELPPLRERRDDIPALTHYFIQKYATKLGRQVTDISDQALSQLSNYDWPGNIRELEHLIERNVLLAAGTTIDRLSMPEQISVSPENKQEPALPEKKMKTLEQVEYDHIAAVLKLCNGKISGSGGAAEVLGLPVSTLNAKLKKMGITRDHYII